MLFEPSLVMLFFIAFLLFFFGGFVIYKNPKSRVHRSYAFLSLSLLVWIFSTYFEDIVVSHLIRNLLLRMDFASAVFAVSCLLLFCLEISKKLVDKFSYLRLGIFIIPTIISILVFFSDYVVKGYEVDSFGILIPTLGSLEFIYNFLIVTIPLISIGLIISGYRAADRKEKAQYAYLFIGVFLTVVISLFTNVLFADYIQSSPFYGFYSRLGVFSSIFIVIFPGYAMLRYRLLDMKIIATELLSFIILLVTFVQIFLAETPYQILIRGIVFVAMLILVVMLLRSVDIEIKRKEELQEMATKLALTNEELRKLDNTKSEFISIASHQLRTPLTAIKGFLSLVLEGSYGKLSGEIEDVLNKVYSANNHLVELVENLLNISRIESGRIQYQFAPTDIADVIRELSDAFSVVAKGRNLNLAFVYPEESVPPFLMDSQKIREVISNMIDNAIKYTQQGGVTLRLSHEGERVRVAVSDTGVGIAPEDLSVLFQKFRRGKESGKVNVSGTGLGLYVGKSFAEAHGGRIFVESDGIGKGSTFVLELPFRVKGNDTGSEMDNA